MQNHLKIGKNGYDRSLGPILPWLRQSSGTACSPLLGQTWVWRVSEMQPEYSALWLSSVFRGSGKISYQTWKQQWKCPQARQRRGPGLRVTWAEPGAESDVTQGCYSCRWTASLLHKPRSGHGVASQVIPTLDASVPTTTRHHLTVDFLTFLLGVVAQASLFGKCCCFYFFDEHDKTYLKKGAQSAN